MADDEPKLIAYATTPGRLEICWEKYERLEPFRQTWSIGIGLRLFEQVARL